MATRDVVMISIAVAVVCGIFLFGTITGRREKAWLQAAQHVVAQNRVVSTKQQNLVNVFRAWASSIGLVTRVDYQGETFFISVE